MRLVQVASLVVCMERQTRRGLQVVPAGDTTLAIFKTAHTYLLLWFRSVRNVYTSAQLFTHAKEGPRSAELAQHPAAPCRAGAVCPRCHVLAVQPVMHPCPHIIHLPRYKSSDESAARVNGWMAHVADFTPPPPLPPNSPSLPFPPPPILPPCCHQRAMGSCGASESTRPHRSS